MSEYRFVVAEGVLTDLDVETAHLRGRAASARMARLATAEDVARETADADAVVVCVEPLPRELIDSLAPTVRIISRAGIGLDTIDLDAARNRGVAVLHTPDYATEEVATHAAALVLALNRKLALADEVARTDWRGWARLKPIRAPSELTLGVVGLGRIGRAVVERLRPFFGAIAGFDPVVAEPPPGVALARSLDELLGQTDVLTLHLPLVEETRGLIGGRELALLRPHAMLVNVARGGLVDQVALAAALGDGTVAAAGLDVLEVEPVPGGDAILSAPNVILSPHVAWYSEGANRRMREMALDGALDYLHGRPVRGGRLAVTP